MSHPQPPPQASGAPAPTAESAAAVQDVAVKRDVLLEDPAEMKLTHVQETALPFGSRPFTRAEELRMGAELMQDTTNRDVKSRPGPGGKRLTYMEGWRSVDVANRVFGFNGWSSQVLSMRINVCNETSQKRWNVCISCTVRVTLKDGSFHEDRGNGSAENYKTESEAIMLAEKEAVTDARKRALKNFGRRLGLSLYSDEHLRNLASGTAKPRAGTAARTCSAVRPQKQHQPPPQAEGFGPLQAAPPPPPPPLRQQQQQARQPQASPGHGGAVPLNATPPAAAAIAQVKLEASDGQQRRARLEKVARLKLKQHQHQQHQQHGGSAPVRQGPGHAQEPCQKEAEQPQQQEQQQLVQPEQPQLQRPTRHPQQPLEEQSVQPPPPQRRQELGQPHQPQLQPAPHHPQQPGEQPPVHHSASTLPPRPAHSPPSAEDAAKREREKEARLLKARLMQEQLKQSREEAKQQARHQPLPLIRAMFTAAQPHQPAGQQPQCVAASPARHASIGMSPVTPAAAPNGQPTASADCRAGTPVRLLPLPIGRPASSPANLAAVGQKRPPPLPGVPPAAKLARTGGLRAAKGGHGQFAAASSLPTGGTCRREEKSTAGSDEEERELLALFAADAIE
jgi:DNA recombination protein Rad52